MFNRRLDLWLPTYALMAPARAYGRLQRSRQTTHIIFLVCDHFEPRHGIARDDQPYQRLRTWQKEYARFQERCRASFGTAPLHTWFYPPHHGAEHLSSLSDMVFDGLGEVELHYHHRDDTAATLRNGLQATLASYRRWGFLLESGPDPRPAFGFIHGDWALDNSWGGKFCGVNGELSILQEMGCWGDFTMPSGNACQTRRINSIYYALGDPSRAKSHNWGTDARVGRKDPPGLFLMQGPLGINWRAPDHPRIENASLTTRNWGREDRVQKWLDCNVHVKDRPEWLFVKLHAHGAIERDFDALFGEKAFEMHRILNEQFNDGRRYCLHYVTARQAYNIAKAAEHGQRGNPADWLDYVIGPQPHTFYAMDAPHDLVHCTKDELKIRNIAPGRAVRLRTCVGSINQLLGPIAAIEIDATAGRLTVETAGSGAELNLAMNPAYRLDGIEGGKVVAVPGGAGDGLLRIAAEPRCCITCRRTDQFSV